MLDDNLYENNISMNYPEVNGFISKETLKWINHCGKLAKDNSAKIIAVSHHNITNHSNYIYDGFTIDNNDEILSAFKKNDITLCFSGHIHFQSINDATLDNHIVKDIATSSLAMYPQKYGVAKFSKDNSLSYATSSVDMNKINSSFKSASRKAFIKFVYIKILMVYLIVMIIHQKKLNLCVRLFVILDLNIMMILNQYHGMK